MNAGEANALRESLRMLERGPGGGWRETLDGRLPGGAPTTLEERTNRIAAWLESWITPPMKAAVDRYWKPAAPSARARAVALVTPATKFLRELTIGRERQGRGEESPAYWIGFYRALAEQAVARVSELETELGRRR